MLPFPRQVKFLRRLDRLLCHTAAGVCVWTLATFTAAGQETHARFLLSTAQVVDAMQNRQLPTRGVQIRLAAPITAAVINPALDIQAIAPLSANEVRLRLTCRDRSECLSFFATATYPDALGRGALRASPQAQPTATVPPPARSPSLVKPILHKGSPAILDFDGDRVHVRLEVICLEGGAAGDKVRVVTRDRKQSYVAEIVAPNVLKGTLTK